MQMQVPGLATTFRVTKEGQGGKAITPGTKATLHATGIIKETGECCHLHGHGAGSPPPDGALVSCCGGWTRSRHSASTQHC